MTASLLADYTTEENGLKTISSEGIELIKEQQREQIDNLIKKRASTQYSIDVEKKEQEQREKEYIDRSLQPNYNNNTNEGHIMIKLYNSMN